MKDILAKLVESPELAQAASDIATHLNTVSKLISEHVERLEQVEQAQQVKKKRERNPDLPKQPTSNYLFFCNAIRPQIEKEFPELVFAQKSRIYGERWRKLSDEEKKPYNEMAQQDRERYTKEMAVYEKTHGVEKKPKLEKEEALPVKRKLLPTVKPSVMVKKNINNIKDSSSSSSSSSSDDSESDSSSDDSNSSDSSDDEEEEDQLRSSDHEDDTSSSSSSDDSSDTSDSSSDSE
ncbi:hypothetical protein RMATCC62417_14959 [Rhizopus microsporus]|nr:hypothetical protein RMATCC62417_14959 [Rhizopus microsporus]